MAQERRKVIAALLIIAAVALLDRTVGAWAYTFANGSGDVWLRGNDAWYHLRLVENMVANWPHVMRFDSYTGYPNGSAVVSAPLMSWLVVGAAKILSSAPSSNLLRTIMALYPPITAVLTIIPVYIIGREVYSKWTGVVAAGLVMLLPTQFLSRTILGFADHHALEALLSVSTVMFLILGYKRRQYRWYACAGAALGLYFAAWHGAVFILAVLLLWLAAQYIIDMYRGSLNAIYIYGPAITAAVTVAMFLPIREFNADWRMSLIALLAMAAVGPILDLYRRFIHSRKVWWFAVAGSAVGGIMLLLAVVPGLRGTMTIALQVALPTNLGIRTIGETKSLDLSYFATVYAANLLTAGAALYWTLRERHEFVLVAVWGAVMLMFTVSQMRWEYYLVMPLALLSAYGFVRVGAYVRREAKRGSSLISLVFLLFATSIAGIQFAFTPSIMTGDWYDALVWLRDNTPPAYSVDRYNELDYRDSADYAVLSWWDYGHMITAVSHRVPVSNPFQQNVIEVAEFFVDGKDIPEAEYVIVDAPMILGKWYAMPNWLGRATPAGIPAPGDSPVYQLWENTYNGWEVVYRNGTVVILQREY